MQESLLIITAIIITESIVEISVDSVLFYRIKNLFGGKNTNSLRYEFFNCGYCQSVWVGIGMAFLFSIKPFNLGPWEPIAWGLLIHRLSNLWHEATNRWITKTYVEKEE